MPTNEDTPGYTGHVEDDDLQLTYMQQRYYDPIAARFNSNDPVGFLGHMQRGNPTMGFNRYAYANNNPYKYTDPDGEFVQVAIGALIGGVISAGIETYKQHKLGNGINYSKIATEGLKGAVVGGATAGVGVFMGAMAKTAEVGKLGTLASESVGSVAGAAIGSGANMVGEATINAVNGEGFTVSDLNATTSEMLGNMAGAGAGQTASAAMKSVTGSGALSAVTREAASTIVTEKIKTDMGDQK